MNTQRMRINIDRIAALVHKESLLPGLKQEAAAAQLKAADLRLALDGLHDQIVDASRRQNEAWAAREREVRLFGEEAARLPWEGWASPDPYPLPMFRAVVDKVLADSKDGDKVRQVLMQVLGVAATAASTVGLAENVARILQETRAAHSRATAQAAAVGVRKVLLEALNLGATSASNVELAEGVAAALKDARLRLEQALKNQAPVITTQADEAMLAWQLRASCMLAALAGAVDPSIKWSGGAVLPTEQENADLCRRATVARSVFASKEAITLELRQQGLTGPLDQCVLALCRDVAGIKAERTAAVEARAEAIAAMAVMDSKLQRAEADVSALRSDLEVARARSKRLKQLKDSMANKLAMLSMNKAEAPPVDG